MLSNVGLMLSVHVVLIASIVLLNVGFSPMSLNNVYMPVITSPIGPPLIRSLPSPVSGANNTPSPAVIGANNPLKPEPITPRAELMPFVLILPTLRAMPMPGLPASRAFSKPSLPSTILSLLALAINLLIALVCFAINLLLSSNSEDI